MTSHDENFDNYPLISTKLKMPRKTSDLILRPRLIEQLNRGLDRKLTLVSAPAGYGKTTLLHSWLGTCKMPSVWVSLDENDNHLPRFFSYFIAAIQTRYPHACQTTLDMLKTQLIPQSGYITAALVNDIAELEEPFVFAFDDYHLIHNAAIHQFMRNLIKVQPEQLHLAITSRSDPPLALSRLRANHQLTEIRIRDLRFSEEEAIQFFQEAVDEEVDGDTASGLNQLAEGWTVGLRLAALSFQSGRDGATILDGFKSGASDFVTDYLMGEVLEQQPASLQEFLLRTSLLDRFCADLCDAVCFDAVETEKTTAKSTPAGQSASEHLARIRRMNLFLVSLDTEHGWYRYHHLFSEMLRSRLLSSHSREQVEAIHRRAFEWSAVHGYIEEAIQHALAANDTESAVDLIESRSQNLLNPIERVVLERWLSLLPEGIIWRRPKILITHAWILFRQWNMTALDSVLDRIESLLDEDAYTPDEGRFIGGQVAALRCVIAYIKHHDFQRAIDLSTRALEQLPESARDARSIALMLRALSQQASGQLDLAVRQLAGNIGDFSPHSPAKTQSYIGLAFIYYAAGDLAQMNHVVSRMLSFAARRSIPNAILGANYAAGYLHYEWNDLDAAEDHLSTVLKLRHRSNFMSGVNAGLGLIRIYQLRGHQDKARELIDILRSENLEIENMDMLPQIEAARAEQYLLQREQTAALSWARSFQSETLQDSIFKFELPILTQTRILVKCGTRAEAQTHKVRLQNKLALLESGNFTNRVIETLAHLVLIYDRLGEPDDALPLLRRAVEMGQPTGFVRSFVDAGVELTPYLEKLHERGVERDYVAKLLAAFDSDSSASPIAAQRSTTNGLADSELVEPLTRREDEIMQLIGRGMSNQEIAEKLVISPHTVKTHATNIYAKLGVRGRTRAIHKARQLGLLPNQS